MQSAALGEDLRAVSVSPILETCGANACAWKRHVAGQEQADHMIAELGPSRRAGRGGTPGGAGSSGRGETRSGGHAPRGIPSLARLAILGTVGLVAHSRAAVAQNATSIQIAAVVMELPAARVLPAYLEGEVRRAGQETRDSESGVGARREELGGGLAVVTEVAGRRQLRVRLEYVAN
jgi:hypothetical protein